MHSFTNLPITSISTQEVPILAGTEQLSFFKSLDWRNAFQTRLGLPSANFADLFDSLCVKGYSRPNIDQEVLDAVTFALRSGIQSVKILELGGGPSIPSAFNANIGAPWSARTLKHLYGTRVDIISTDIAPDTFVYSSNPRLQNSPLLFCAKIIGLTHSGEIHCREAHIDFQRTIPDQLERDNLTFRLASSKYLEAADREFITIMKLLNKTRPLGKVQFEKVIVRPYIDSEIEKEVFGIERIGKVDIWDESTLPKGKFNIIFARHLAPCSSHTGSLEIEEKPLLEMLSRHLTEDGTILLGIDTFSDDGNRIIKNRK